MFSALLLSNCPPQLSYRHISWARFVSLASVAECLQCVFRNRAHVRLAVSQVNIDFEPFRAINTTLYLCDNKFHTEVCAGVVSDARPQLG